MASLVTMVVGHTDNMSIVYLDQHGNPMLVTPIPDSPPTWVQANSSVATLTVAADGLTASEKAIAVGSDTVSLTVVVGGANFSASVPINVTAEPQVLTSVDIVSSVV